MPIYGSEVLNAGEAKRNPIMTPPRSARPIPAVEIAAMTADIPERAVKHRTDNTADENVEYVYKLNTKTVVAVACFAIVFILLSVLFVVNAVNIAQAKIELRQLQSEQAIAEAEYYSAQADAALAKENAIRQLEDNMSAEGEYRVIPTGTLPNDYDRYKPQVDLESSTNAFDAICEFLSKIF
jgi:hypothetical protein